MGLEESQCFNDIIQNIHYSANPDVVTVPVFSHVSRIHKHISTSIHVTQMTCLLLSGQSRQLFGFSTRSDPPCDTLTRAQSRAADDWHFLVWREARILRVALHSNLKTVNSLTCIKKSDLKVWSE